MKSFKKITLGVLGAVLLTTGLYSCSNDDLVTENKLETNYIASSKPGSSRFLRFNLARFSKFCESGFGICTMKDYDRAQELKKALEAAEAEEYGIQKSTSVYLPIDPSQDYNSGVVGVEYDFDELMATNELVLDFKLSNKPSSSSPISLFVDENVVVEIEGQIFELPAAEYNYNKTLGEFGGYSLKIVKK